MSQLPQSRQATLEQAIWRTLAYVDLFDYPLTAVEIHRYLDGVVATLHDVRQVLTSRSVLAAQVSCLHGFYCLAGREEVVALRQMRQQTSQKLWAEARRYGNIIAQLPFVHMVAVTGSLAMSNVIDKADIDYFIVTENGRLWLTRALIVGVVRWAARRGILLCPNYFVSESALGLADQTIYTAREIAQMVPLSGLPTYQRLRQQNQWVLNFLPNADGPPQVLAAESQPKRWLQAVTELPLRTPLGTWLEQWEQARKIAKLTLEQTVSEESCFTAVMCKGHFQAHQKRTLRAYQNRITKPFNPKGNSEV
ncbi:hypothetical protein [Candidatus Leptofilum sp.]|uniref:hypothetical protein n=1 Tax=Candidatus Leptofilum sp. TaxID=3241576 RepID=UPI003B5B0DE9